jgi:2-oxoglutarate ferredoxin oxidoreductase subunit beta
VTVGENGVTENDLLVHDETDESLAYLLTRMDPVACPVPLGVFHCEPDFQPYEQGIAMQVQQAREAKKPDLMQLIHAGDTWTVD